MRNWRQPISWSLSLMLPALMLLAGCKQSSDSFIRRIGISSQPLFESLNSAKTGLEFNNPLPNREQFNILYYLYFYNGGGVAIGDINRDGLSDLFFTANSKGNNKLFLNKGNLTFEDITEKAGVKGSADWSSGVTMADVNADGLLDIYVSTVSGRYGLKGHNELFINKGGLRFEEHAQDYGLDTRCATTQSAFFDYDRDGDLDCYILNQSHHPHQNLVDTSVRHSYDSISGDRLLRNDEGKFTDVSKQLGIYQSSLGYGLGIAIADFNNDGWDDIYIGNDFHENDYYYLNKEGKSFVESGSKHFGHYSRFSMGNDAADYNNDGHIDVMTVDMLPPDEKTLKTYGSDENPNMYKVKIDIQGYQKQYSKNALQRNNGNGVSFSELSLMAGVSATDWSWAPLIADFDLDGKKDIFITSGIVSRPVDLDYVKFVSNQKTKGLDTSTAHDAETIRAMPDGASHPFFFKGNANDHFEDMSDTWGTKDLNGYFNGAAYGDLDNDGDLDMVVNQLNATALMLENTQSKKHSISFKFEPLAHKTPIGTKLWIFTSAGMQTQHLQPTRGFQSSVDFKMVFGLDTIQNIDSVLVVWPNQQMQVIRNVQAGALVSLRQQDANGFFVHNNFFPPNTNDYQTVSLPGFPVWKHQENEFLDYNVQYLIPHAESTRGPKMAVGDVNGDGRSDFYVCGAKFQPGSLFVQNASGGFSETNKKLFETFAVCEDVDAVFLDVNGDGFEDLYVVSGGNEMPTNELALADRIFVNDGKGNFKLLGGALPALHENKSCVAAADADKDGDIDVFIGFLSDPLKYGIPQNSYLLLNNGQGKFSVAPNAMMNLIGVGMVTDAEWVDLNNDTWLDLVVAGEFMPIKIFFNHRGSFTPAELPSSTGLWQTLSIADVNSDGKPDILAGNWGHNSKLYAGKNGPVKLYTKDFDNNGIFEQILAYTINGEEYPFLAKDELERSLPVLRKAYLTYGEVAGKSVQYILYDLFKGNTSLMAEQLGTTCFINTNGTQFKAKLLPADCQLAPVMTIKKINQEGDFLVAGNFFGVIPFEGRYDALFPTIIRYDPKTDNFIVKQKMESIRGEVRDMETVVVGGRAWQIITRNNDETVVFGNRNR